MDYRVWTLFVIYGACFSVELTINNIAALYYHDRFGLSVGTAGLIAGLFGLMNIFARTLGGIIGDRAGIRLGLRGRVMFLGVVLLLLFTLSLVTAACGDESGASSSNAAPVDVSTVAPPAGDAAHADSNAASAGRLSANSASIAELELP